MFTWICPKCGREVPPAYTDCPDCNPQIVPAAAAPPQRPYAPPQQPPYAAPPQQQYAPPQQPYAPAPPASGTGRRPIWQSAPPQQPYTPPPQQAYAPPPPAYAPPPPPPQAYVPPPPPEAYAPAQPVYSPPPPPPAPEPRPSWDVPPPPARGPALPTWLLGILFAVAFGGLVAGAYALFGTKSPSTSSAASDSGVQLPVTAPGGKVNPYQKFVEISGVRFAEDPKNKERTIVKFVITNHADDDMTGLSGTVAILSRSDKSGQPVAGFTFTTTLGPQESKDLTTTLTTKMKAYELPDWQFAQPVLQITAPGGASGGSQ